MNSQQNKIGRARTLPAFPHVICVYLRSCRDVRSPHPSRRTTPDIIPCYLHSYPNCTDVMYQLCRICRLVFTFVFPLLHALSAACALIFLNKPLRILTLKVQLLPGDTCRLGKRSVEASRILRTSLDACRTRNRNLCTSSSQSDGWAG